jgi:glutathione peroxidase
MKITFIVIGVAAAIGLISYSFISKRNATHPPLNKNFYDLKIKSLDGKSTINMSDFKGKKVLCVNVASKCGYTKQYEGLQRIADKYSDKLVVIGFPCNQFLNQESGSAQDIEQFCKKNFGVTFPLTEKIDVKGSSQHEVYQWLCQKDNNKVEDYTVKWNFNKFLIDENGNLIAYFPSSVEPEDNKLISAIEKN